MSEINTPEPPSRPEDQLISEMAAEPGQISSPTTAASDALSQAKSGADVTKSEITSEVVELPAILAESKEVELQESETDMDAEAEVLPLENRQGDERERKDATRFKIKEEQVSIDDPASSEGITEPTLDDGSRIAEEPTSFSLTDGHPQKIEVEQPLLDNNHPDSSPIDEKPTETLEAKPALDVQQKVDSKTDTTMSEDAGTVATFEAAQNAGRKEDSPTEQDTISTRYVQPSFESRNTPSNQRYVLEKPLAHATHSTDAPVFQQSGPSALTSTPITADATTTNQVFNAQMNLPSIPAIAESSSTILRRPSPHRVSMEAQEKARHDEAIRLQRENEDMRLMWLSLPANDHLTYYSETEDEASGSGNEGIAPKGAYGGMPLLSRRNVAFGNMKRKRKDWWEDEKESSDSDDENQERLERADEKQYRTGNRGNKLLKGSRWNRRGKLGLWTEAKNEKEMHDRFMSRIKAIQRAGVESLLNNAPGPKVIQNEGPVPRDMLEGSDRMLIKDIHSANIMEENLQSTSLAPALLRPILSARALLESHTLRHTFRNPHIGALSKTALDLRESEGHLSRALGRCFSAMEKMNAYVEDLDGEVRVNGSQNSNREVDLKAIGAEGTSGTADEINPALVQLDDLFVTKKGLPIPVVSSEGEQAMQTTELQAVLSTNQQRDVIRAALECLQDLGLDSLEYVERLDEVRGRLEGVKRRRMQVWEALRLWALKRDGGGEEEEDNEGEVEEEEMIVNSKSTTKPIAVNASAPNRRKR